MSLWLIAGLFIFATIAAAVVGFAIGTKVSRRAAAISAIGAALLGLACVLIPNSSGLPTYALFMCAAGLSGHVMCDNRPDALTFSLFMELTVALVLLFVGFIQLDT